MMKCDAASGFLRGNFLLLQFIVLCCFFITSLGFFPYFLSSSIAQFKLWYPNFYLPIYLVLNIAVLSIFTLQSQLISNFFLKAINAKKGLFLTLSLSTLTFLIFKYSSLDSAYIFLIITAIFLGLIKYYIVIISLVKASCNYSSVNAFKAFLWIGVIALVVFRLYFTWHSDNVFNSDAPCRQYIAHVWLKCFLYDAHWTYKVSPNVDWLPLHFYIIGAIEALTASEHAIILAHGIAGVWGCFYIYKISELLFDKQVALVALVLCLAYPAGVAVSSAMLSEPWFMLFVAAGIFYYLKYLFSTHTKYLLAHIACIAAAALVRFEIWPMLLVFPFVNVVFSAGRIKRQHFLYIAYLVIPIAVMYLAYLQGFSPFRWLLYSDEQVKFGYDHIGRSIWVVIEGYAYAWIPGLILSFLFFVLKYINGLKQWIYVFLLLLFVFPFLLKVANYSLMPDSRYWAKYAVFFIPFMAFMVVKFTRNKFLFQFIGLGVALGLVSFGLLFTNTVGFNYPNGFKENVAFVNAIKTGNFISDRHRGNISYSWLSLTDLPIVLDYNDWYLRQYIPYGIMEERVKREHSPKKIKFIVNDENSMFGTTNYAALDSVLSKYNDLYIVFFPDGNLTRHFQFSDSIETIGVNKFQRLYQYQDYQVYKKVE